MADSTKKFDPFKPAQPSIPGVPAAPAKSGPPVKPPEPTFPQASPPRKPVPARVWITVGLMIVLGLGGAWYWAGPKTKTLPAVGDVSVAASVSVDGTRQSARLPVGPGIIGATKDIEKPWASKPFLFRSDLSSQLVPALVVHLPNGQYWGFSMIEPFGNCKLDYITDLQVLQTEYGFGASHPMVGDPCTHTVYDLLQYAGGAPDGGLVRGAIVHGAGVRPPMAIEIDVDGKQLRAVRME